jgi:hypothetical protein
MLVSEIRFEQCPKCNTVWRKTKNYFECLKCYTTYWIELPEELRIFDFSKSIKQLVFNFTENICRVINYNNPNIILPMLPLNISEKQLKKLITFI